MVEQYTRRIEIESVINFRDLGGYYDQEGNSIAWRRIFRSGDFRKITPEDFARIEKEIGLKSVIDLRTSDEIKMQGKWPTDDIGIRYNHVPFPGDGGGDPHKQDKILKEGTNLGQLYLHMVENKEFAKQLTKALEIIADPKCHPLVFHCAIGKDRTGILSAILLSILRIDDTVIVEDYTLSGPPIQKLRERMELNPPDKEYFKHLPDYFWQAAPESMALFLSTLKKKYGSMVGYLINLGIDTYLIEGIRKVLLV